ncbi:MAG: LPS export ABC transporter ATP-binding protein [Planctomycetaceae bacterium]|jgi:lipopolysaccharide export system ATP-binding protein|nr:LPS export ABC transporter ATP-binding protein [Planctomycetaceae bacterium]
MLKQTTTNSNMTNINTVNIIPRRTLSNSVNVSSNSDLGKDSLRQIPIVLRADGLVKIYGKRRVVDGVSFHVNRGEIVGLLGPNGAGKTTSFRMVCGLISSNGGIVYLGPHDITNWPMYRRSREGGMGYLPQDKSVFQKLSVQNNLLAIMEMIGVKKQDRLERCNELLEKFKLTHLRRNMGGSLSGGEKRRLEIARALVSNPKIILLDEPFAAVDPITVTSIQAIIRQLSNEGISILITDHSVQDTLQITHRSYVIRTGQVLCHGTPEEVINNAEARKVYFGENVNVGQIKSTNVKIDHSTDTNPKIISDKKITPVQNLHDSKDSYKSYESEKNKIKNELFDDTASTVLIENRNIENRNYDTRPKIIQKEPNHKSNTHRPLIESAHQTDKTTNKLDLTSQRHIDSQASIMNGNNSSSNNNNNSTRPATRRLIPSSSSVIIPAAQFESIEGSPVRSSAQNQKTKSDSNLSSSGIMQVLGTMFFGKNR